MNNKQKDFLNKLADLCDVYKPEFFYTNDDDGIHIRIDNEDIFIDYDITAETIRSAIRASGGAKIKEETKKCIDYLETAFDLMSEHRVLYPEDGETEKTIKCSVMAFLEKED